MPEIVVPPYAHLMTRMSSSSASSIANEKPYSGPMWCLLEPTPYPTVMLPHAPHPPKGSDVLHGIVFDLFFGSGYGQ